MNYYNEIKNELINKMVKDYSKNKSDFLIKNFDDWISVLYASPADMRKSISELKEKMNVASNNLFNF